MRLHLLGRRKKVVKLTSFQSGSTPANSESTSEIPKFERVHMGKICPTWNRRIGAGTPFGESLPDPAENLPEGCLSCGKFATRRPWGKFAPGFAGSGKFARTGTCGKFASGFRR